MLRATILTVVSLRRTVEEWEVVVGDQVRSARFAADLDQRTLAARADVSVGAVRNLEGGNGSSLRTLIRVVRALDRLDWLEALAPPITVSPLRMLAARRSEPPRPRRASRRRSGD